MSSQFLRIFTVLCFAIAVTNSLRTTVFERKILGEKQDLRLCVTRQVEFDKCNALNQVFIDNKFDYRLECCLNTVEVCVQKIRDGKCDFMVLEYQDELLARNFGLKPYLFEEYSKDSYIVAIVDDDVTMDDIRMRQLNFDFDDIREVRAALLFNRIHQGVNVRNTCERDDDFVRTQFDDYRQYYNDLFYRQKMNLARDRYDDRSIRFLRSNQMKDYDLKGKVLICPDLKVRGLEFYDKCNFDTGSVRTIYGRDLDEDRMYLINALKQIVNLFKGKSRTNVVLNEYDQLRLFGQFNGLRNVLFDDDAVGFSMLRKFRNGIDELRLNELFCLFDQDQRQQQFYDDDDVRMRRDFNILRDPEYYQQLSNLDRYRQFMMDKRYNPYFDYYRYRQYFIDNRFNPNLNVVDNENVQQNYDVDRVRRQIYDTDRNYPYYNFDRYQQYLNVDQSRQLPAVDRFRDILGLSQYRQQYSYPDYYRQNFDINQNRQFIDLADRDRQMLDDDRTRQYQYYDRFYNIDRDRQMLDDDRTRKYQYYDRFNNVDRQISDVDRNREILKDDRQYQNFDQFYNLDRERQMLDSDRTYRINPYVDRFRQIVDPYRGVQQYYNKDVMYRQNYDNDVNRQFFDIDRTYRTYPNVDRFRQTFDVNRGVQQYYDQDAMYRQNYDNDVNLRKNLIDPRYGVYRSNLNDYDYRQNMDIVRDRKDFKVDRTASDVDKERKETKKDRKVLDDKRSRQ